MIPVLAGLAVQKHLKVLRRSLPHGSRLGNSQNVHGIEFRNVELSHLPSEVSNSKTSSKATCRRAGGRRIHTSKSRHNGETIILRSRDDYLEIKRRLSWDQETIILRSRDDYLEIKRQLSWDQETIILRSRDDYLEIKRRLSWWDWQTLNPKP